MMEVKLIINDTEFSAVVTGIAHSPHIPKLQDVPDSAECTFEVCNKHQRCLVTYRMHPGDAENVLRALTNGMEQ